MIFAGCSSGAVTPIDADNRRPTTANGFEPLLHLSVATANGRQRSGKDELGTQTFRFNV
jgi:hypothetical protein